MACMKHPQSHHCIENFHLMLCGLDTRTHSKTQLRYLLFEQLNDCKRKPEYQVQSTVLGRERDDIRAYDRERDRDRDRGQDSDDERNNERERIISMYEYDDNIDNLKGIELGDICFLESSSLFNMVLNEVNSAQDVAIEELGFCAIVTFKDILDAVKLFSREYEISVPLNFQEKDGMPTMIPSKALINFIEQFD